MAGSPHLDFFLLDSVLPKIIILEECQRVSVHEINRKRTEEGEYHRLFPRLKSNPSRFHSYMRMSFDTFNFILEKIELRLAKDRNNWHQQPIMAEERLVVMLRAICLDALFLCVSCHYVVFDTQLTSLRCYHTR